MNGKGATNQVKMRMAKLGRLKSREQEFSCICSLFLHTSTINALVKGKMEKESTCPLKWCGWRNGEDQRLYFAHYRHGCSPCQKLEYIEYRAVLNLSLANKWTSVKAMITKFEGSNRMHDFEGLRKSRMMWNLKCDSSKTTSMSTKRGRCTFHKDCRIISRSILFLYHNRCK